MEKRRNLSMDRIRTILIILVVLAAVLSGCSLPEAVCNYLNTPVVIPYEDMVYERPNPEELAEILAQSCRTARESTSLEETENAIYDYYDAYDRVVTALALADIEYSKNMADLYWSEEYDYCLSLSPQADAGLEELYRALARSPVREELEGADYFGPGYFDEYEGEAVMDEGYLAIAEKETELLSRYYDLAEEYAGAEDYDAGYGPMMEVFVELVRVRRELAEYCGYDSYPEFAYDFQFCRDYTPAQSRVYLEALRQELTGHYRAVNRSDIWDRMDTRCQEDEVFDYVQSAAEAMGGEIAEGFRVLEKGGLYDIAPGENKFESAFEIYLWSYYEPFIFMNPTQTPADMLAFAHEFGHFLNDHLCWGSYAGTDVAEVHSQAMEYLSLCYGGGPEILTEYKLADCLCTYMESGAMALFELEVYDLPEEELTPEGVGALYEEICLSFGFDSWEDWDSRSFITVSHFFTDPMYLISYVVSNDLAVQIYQAELHSPGAGLEIYSEALYSEDSDILAFAKTYGLTSPFAPSRMDALKELFGTG